MRRRNRSLTISLVVVVAVALSLVFASAALAASMDRLTVGAGQTYLVSEVTTVRVLTVAQGGVLKATQGYSLTMTVDGVETGGEIYSWPAGIFDPPPPFAPPGSPDSERYGGECRIKPGTYQGRIVLTPTLEMLLARGAPFPAGNEPYQWPYRTGLYIDATGVVASKSVLAAVSGTVTNRNADDITIASTGDYFNGIMFMGNARYVLNSPFLDMTGNGHGDFGGFGAAVRVAENANVVINKANIATDGVTRSGVWVGGTASVTVNDSRIVTGLGVLPADWLGGPFPPGTGGSMLTVPWMLGISGNCRSTSVVAKGSATYNNCYIEAQQWGALSTDMCQDGHLTANNCTIKVVESGYGAYSDQQVDDYFDHTTFDVPDYGVIMTGPGTTTFTNACVVNSKRWGMMFHGGAPGTVNIDEGTVFNTGLTCFLMKNSYPTINVDNAQLSAGNGIILQAMASDDPMSPDQSGGDTSIDATFSNMSMKGDIVNTMTAKGNVNVKLVNATLTGALTTGAQTFLGVYPRTIDARQDIGMISNTYGATTDKYGITASIDAKSTWVVSKTSYLNSLSFERGTIQAPAGYKAGITVNGKPIGLRAGSYSGAIVVTVTPLTVGSGRR